MKRRDFASLALLTFGGYITNAFSSNSFFRNKFLSKSISESCHVTVTTLFPYEMTREEFKTQLSKWKDNTASKNILLEMQKEKKILSYKFSLYKDRDIAQFEFVNVDSWKEYNSRFNQVLTNAHNIKKQLGFTSKTEIKKSMFV